MTAPCSTPSPTAAPGASAVTTIDVQAVALDTFGAGYTSAPTVTITDSVGNGSGATATASVDNGLVSAIAVTAPGTGYVTPGGIKKFQDQLPMLCNPAVPGSCSDVAGAKFLPIGVPEEKTYNDPNGKPIKSDEYEIALIQYRSKFNTDLPATLVRGYVQVETPTWVAAHPGVSQHVALENELLNGTKVPVMIDGQQAYGVTAPQWLGPIIGGDQGQARPRRLPQPAAHRLRRRPLPADRQHAHGLRHGPDGSARPGRRRHRAGRGAQPRSAPRRPSSPTASRTTAPRCTFTAASARGSATARRTSGSRRPTRTPRGRRAWTCRYVPDMPVGNDPRDGVMTFYYTNQQSARLMFYHDHAWGITRLNVYAGEAAGYLISDDTEKALVGSGTIPADQIPLVVQDRTFVPAGLAAVRHDGTRRARSSPTARTRPGTRPAGAATATSGTTTCTCRRRTPATPAA